jgi:hypothetical protein
MSGNYLSIEKDRNMKAGSKWTTQTAESWMRKFSNRKTTRIDKTIAVTCRWVPLPGARQDQREETVLEYRRGESLAWPGWGSNIIHGSRYLPDWLFIVQVYRSWQASMDNFFQLCWMNIHGSLFILSHLLISIITVLLRNYDVHIYRRYGECGNHTNFHHSLGDYRQDGLT